MTDRELLKEARDLIVMCSLLDKSGQCNKMADKMDKQLSIPVVSNNEVAVCQDENHECGVSTTGFCTICQLPYLKAN